MKPDLQVEIAGVTLKNPVMTASGTFGSGMEYGDYMDLSRLGAVVTKGVANVPWPGNPVPRVAEVRSGMLNAVGKIRRHDMRLFFPEQGGGVGSVRHRQFQPVNISGLITFSVRGKLKARDRNSMI